jgi:hypothetical protein
MGGSLQLPILDVRVIVSLLGLGACTVWLALRSQPAALTSRQKRVEDVVAGFGVELETISSERATWKVQGEKLAEEVSTYLDQIERKRASTAASASRIAAVTGKNGAEDVGSMSRQEQLNYVRSKFGG